MNNINKLLNSTRKDERVLGAWLVRRGVAKLVNSHEWNRGDFGETGITRAQCYRTGKHGQSEGDAILIQDGTRLLIEVKTLSTRTRASDQEQGTKASHYLLVCYTTKGMFFRLVEKSELVHTANGQIRLQDNADKGEEIDIEKVEILPLWDK